MPKIKLRHTQTHVAVEDMQQRLDLCRWYLDATRTMYELTFPDDQHGYGANMELMIVLMGVFVADGDGRAASATKIAAACGLPRATVYRRLDQLKKLGRVVREGRGYFIAPGAAPLDKKQRIPKMMASFPVARPSKSDT